MAKVTPATRTVPAIQTLDELGMWVTDAEEHADFKVAPMPLAESSAWQVLPDELRHVSGSFFQVVACVDGSGHAQPLLNQREIGLLGNIVRQDDEGLSVLVQLKAEPGNRTRYQLTCTVQATRGNMRRKHGGFSPPFSERFRPAHHPSILSHSHESEQGSRFLGKWNACWSILSENGGEDDELPVLYRWVDVRLLATLLEADCRITTDLRSVLLRCPWEQQFPETQLHSIPQLGRSFTTPTLDEEAIRRLRTCLNKHHGPMRIPFQDLDGWSLSENGLIRLGDGGFSVRQYRACISDREVPEWDQPLIQSEGDGRVLLLLREQEGRWEFLVAPRDEIGYVRRTQLSTPYILEPGESEKAQDWSSVQAASVPFCGFRQAEEGGRFFHEENDYEIRMLQDSGYIQPEGAQWITLADMRRLPGLLCSETRTALSVLLKPVLGGGPFTSAC